MSRPIAIPAGTWPARMPAQLAAGYCGEVSVDAFLRKVGPAKEYPPADCGKGRGRKWLKATLDRAINPSACGIVADVADDL